MKKANDKLKINNNIIIVDNDKYELLNNLKFIVKTIREDDNYPVMLKYLYKYYDYVSHNFNFIVEVVRLMPLSFLKEILLESEIEWFNAYNNN